MSPNQRMRLDDLGLDSEEDMATEPASTRSTQAGEKPETEGGSQKQPARRRASTSKARAASAAPSTAKRNRLRSAVNTVALSLMNLERRQAEKREELVEVAEEAREAGVSPLEIQGWIVGAGLSIEHVPDLDSK